MDKTTTFLGWVAGGTGIILLYSAYRNQNPVDVVTNALNGSGSEVRKITDTWKFSDDLPEPGETTTTGSPYNMVGTQMQKAYQVGGTADSTQWVSIGSQPQHKLAAPAAASFARVEAKYGKKIGISGAGRSYAAQVIGYATAPERFGKPGTSLHEFGLAVDLNQIVSLMEDPKLIEAFQSEGWFRRGKRGNWFGQENIPEPWHWSYLVPG